MLWTVGRVPHRGAGAGPIVRVPGADRARCGRTSYEQISRRTDEGESARQDGPRSREEYFDPTPSYLGTHFDSIASLRSDIDAATQPGDRERYYRGFHRIDKEKFSAANRIVDLRTRAHTRFYVTGEILMSVLRGVQLGVKGSDSNFTALESKTLDPIEVGPRCSGSKQRNPSFSGGVSVLSPATSRP